MGRGMMAFGRETLAQAMPEMVAMVAAHMDEIGQWKGSPMRPDVDWALFRRVEAEGGLVLFTVREEGALAGYAVWLLHNHPHYKSTLVAQSDALYLAPAARRGRLFARWLGHMELALAALGAQKIVCAVKPERDYGALLERRGFGLMETVYHKWIGD